MPIENTPTVRNPRREAAVIAGTGVTALVLEPSPPAVAAGPWFADDPVDPRGGDGTVLAPAGVPGDLRWRHWLDAHPEHEAWVMRRWLAGPRRLPAPPPTLATTRTSLHRLAASVVAPARHAVNGRFGLRWTLGGFGTPFFGDDRQIRVEGATLVDQHAGEVRSTPVTTLAAAARFLGVAIDPDTAAEHDTPTVGDPDEPLDIDPSAGDWLGEWFGMAFAALEAFRADGATIAPSRPQLWPGHFDAAIEAGDDDRRASYGASPGDVVVPEPYLYVSIWWPDRARIDRDLPLWNAPGFVGRVLRLSDFGDDDAVAIAASFWRHTRDSLG